MRVLGQKNYRGGAKRPPPSLFRVKGNVGLISSDPQIKAFKGRFKKALFCVFFTGLNTRTISVSKKIPFTVRTMIEICFS